MASVKPFNPHLYQRIKSTPSYMHIPSIANHFIVLNINLAFFSVRMSIVFLNNPFSVFAELHLIAKQSIRDQGNSNAFYTNKLSATFHIHEEKKLSRYLDFSLVNSTS